MRKLSLAILSYLFLMASTTVFAQVETYTQDKLGIAATPKNSQFIIKLESNPRLASHGFLREYDGTLITPVKHQFTPPGNQKLMGAPGFELWTFHVKSQGFIVPQQTTIRFVYARPWEGADQSTQVVFRVSTLGK